MSDFTESMDRKNSQYFRFTDTAKNQEWHKHCTDNGLEDVRLYQAVNADGHDQFFLVGCHVGDAAADIRAVLDRDGSSNPAVLQVTTPCPPFC